MNIFWYLMIFLVTFFIFSVTNSLYVQGQLQSASTKTINSISTDKDSYISNDIVYFSGIVKPIISNQFVQITIKDPNNNTVHLTNVPVDNNGRYKDMVIAGDSTWKSSGLYIVEALYGSSKSTSTFAFKMSHPKVQVVLPSEILQGQDTAQSNSVEDLIISTNKLNYNINDSVIITGIVNPSDATMKYVRIIVTDSNFITVYEDFVSPDSSGRFNSIIYHGKYLVHPGTFILTVTSGSDAVKLKFTINNVISEVSNSIPEFSYLPCEILVFSTILVISITRKFMFKIL
jgi:hypothetical protein